MRRSGSGGFLAPWLALSGGLALHVADEALTGFLELWNPLALRVRSEVPWLPLPTFGFAAWLGGLILAVAVLLALSPLAAAGSRGLRILAWPYAVLMLLNGLGHLAASIHLGRPAPGVLSAPVLVVCSIWLLRALGRAGGRAARPGSRREGL